jgi:alkylation response protein AidB-like acyl-CoA dehydrogenase
MDWNTLGDDEFRNEVRAFIAAKLPDRLRNHPHRIPRWEVTREWYLELSNQGWLAPNWPQEYGGMGLSASKMLIYTAEVERAGIPRLYDMGLFMLGPILIRHGSEEQKQFYLPKILSGEHRWAQGYSEPDAGSDLASLRTWADAALDGGFIVNGQKTWSTFIDDATHMFFLARTRRGEKKQQGISFFVTDLAANGIRRRLIKTLSGQDELGEVFFDDVRLSAGALVGQLHNGWTIAKDLLEFERINNGSPKLGLYAIGLLSEFATQANLFDDAGFVTQFTRLRLDLEDQMAAYRHFSARVKAGQQIGPEISLLKIWSTETFQRIAELFLEFSGEAGLAGKSAHALGALRLFYNSRPASIYSGCNEVQRDIIARHILHLPRHS